MLRKLYRFYKNHYYEVTGGLIGLALGLSFVLFGIIKTIVLAVCIFLGLFVGRKLKADRNFVKNIIDKILPPGSYR